MQMNGQVVAKLMQARQQGTPALAMDYMGGTLVSELLPRYSMATKSGLTYSAVGLGVTDFAAATSMSGFILYNPAGSGIDAHFTKAFGQFIVSSPNETDLLIGVVRNQATAPTGTTALTVQNNYVGSTANAGGAVQAFSVATLASAPVALLPVLHNAAAIAATGEDPGFYIDLEGSLILGPGACICLMAQGGTSASAALNAAMEWVELPI
jgi:hypothetical protein